MTLRLFLAGTKTWLTVKVCMETGAVYLVIIPSAIILKLAKERIILRLYAKIRHGVIFLHAQRLDGSGSSTKWPIISVIKTMEGQLTTDNRQTCSPTVPRAAFYRHLVHTAQVTSAGRSSRLSAAEAECGRRLAGDKKHVTTTACTHAQQQQQVVVL